MPAHRGQVKVEAKVEVESRPRREVPATSPLTEPVLALLPVELEIHDAIICATAILLQEEGGDAVRVLTCDRQIAGSGLVKSAW